MTNSIDDTTSAMALTAIAFWGIPQVEKAHASSVFAVPAVFRRYDEYRVEGTGSFPLRVHHGKEFLFMRGIKG